MVWKGVPMKKLLFIVNPRAGKTKSRAPLFDAVAQFSRAGYLVRVYITEAGGQACDITARWGGQYDMVVCAGGDGTLNETLSGLMQLEQRPLLGYLPCGSTNDFAMSLHLHTMLPAAAEAAATGTPCPLDVGRHNDRYFAYVASFGAFTRSSYSATQAAKNALGHFAYILEGLGDLDSLPAPTAARWMPMVSALRGVHFRRCVQFHLPGRPGEAGSLPCTDGRRKIRTAAAPYAKDGTGSAEPYYRHDPYAVRLSRRDTAPCPARHPDHRGEPPWSLDGEYCPSAPAWRSKTSPPPSSWSAEAETS